MHDGLVEMLNAGLLSLHTSVAGLCEAIDRDPGRYPALRTIGVRTTRYGKALDWRTMAWNSTKGDAMALARHVRGVGLRLVDATGEPRQDAWFDESA